MVTSYVPPAHQMTGAAHRTQTFGRGVNGVNNPCPSGYRLPTETEFNAERLSWSPNNNSAGAFDLDAELKILGF